MIDNQQEKRVPFNYEKYLSGDYKAVYRSCSDVISKIALELKEPTAVYAVYDDGICNVSPWYVNRNGRLSHSEKHLSDYDVFLVPITKEEKG